MYQIEKGIPIPTGRKAGNSESGTLKYPWATLEVGDSFVAPGHASTMVTRANKIYGSRKFTARKQPDGTCRFWRTA